MIQRLYCAKMVQPPKKLTWMQAVRKDIIESSKTSIRKLFAPPGSSTSHRVIAGLNRFGPFQLFNPLFMWKLQSSFRPYVTMTISVLSALLYGSSILGTPDSTMRLAAVPVRYWEGDSERLFTSAFLHTSFVHLASVSGFLLAFGTAIEVAAGPVVLLSVLLSSAVAGCAAAICAPDRQTRYERCVVSSPTMLSIFCFRSNLSAKYANKCFWFIACTLKRSNSASGQLLPV
jgi:membrane associated rhomboid family serine protease